MRHEKPKKTADANPTTSIVTYNRNGFHSSIKRQRETGLKKMIQLYIVYKIHTLDSQIYPG